MGEEKVVWEGKPSWLNYPVELILGTLLLPAMGLGIVFLLLAVIQRAFADYKITNQRVVSKVGLLVSKRAEVEIGDIRNINVVQDLWQRIFSLGTIEISSAGGGGIEVTFAGVPNPETVKEKIRSLRGKN